MKLKKKHDNDFRLFQKKEIERKNHISYLNCFSIFLLFSTANYIYFFHLSLSSFLVNRMLNSLFLLFAVKHNFLSGGRLNIPPDL